MEAVLRRVAVCPPLFGFARGADLYGRLRIAMRRLGVPVKPCDKPLREGGVRDGFGGAGTICRTADMPGGRNPGRPAWCGTAENGPDESGLSRGQRFPEEELLPGLKVFQRVVDHFQYPRKQT